VEYRIQKEGITSYLTVLYARSACALTLDDRKIEMMKRDLILAGGGLSYTCDEDLFTVSAGKEFFDDLFFSQMADCQILHDMFLNPKGEYLFFHTEGEEGIHAIMKQLKEESAVQDVSHEKVEHLLIIHLLTSLERIRPHALAVSNSTMLAENRFGKIMKYLGEHYAETSLKDIAEVFGYHPDYLSTRFKKITGVTFQEKLLSIRLERAQYLLTSTNMTIEQIAEEVGFHDKSWLTKKFCEAYGTTPGRYRRSRRESKV